jgi:hypothetical protein
MSDIFRSIPNIIGDGRHDTEKATMELCRDLLAAHRINRKGREDQPLTETDQTRMRLIGKLANGPHRAVVLGMIVEYFPNMAGSLGMDKTQVGNA